jgi:hypothetical protein
LGLASAVAPRARRDVDGVGSQQDDLLDGEPSSVRVPVSSKQTTSIRARPSTDGNSTSTLAHPADDLTARPR